VLDGPRANGRRNGLATPSTPQHSQQVVPGGSPPPLEIGSLRQLPDSVVGRGGGGPRHFDIENLDRSPTEPVGVRMKRRMDDNCPGPTLPDAVDTALQVLAVEHERDVRNVVTVQPLYGSAVVSRLKRFSQLRIRLRARRLRARRGSAHGSHSFKQRVDACPIVRDMRLLPLVMLALPPVQWMVRTSQGFDALCAINILSGDPYYAQQYAADTAMFNEPRYAAARDAAHRLRTSLKDQRGMIISAFLTLVLSGGPDSTLDAVIESAKSPARLEAPFRASPFWNEKSWQTFLAVDHDVVTALVAMRDAGFAADWSRSLGSDPSARVASLRGELAKFDVMGEQRRLVGRGLPEDRIEIILLRFSRPHGIRVQGARFLTDVGYPTSIVLRNAAHEPLHAAIDSAVRAQLTVNLVADSLILAVVAKHNRSYGYNSLDGYVEEDVTQALDQVVGDRLGFSAPAAARWRTADDGMHLLAAALYDLMRETGFVAAGGSFGGWLNLQIAAGHLSPAEIERRARRIVGEDVVRGWKERG
jgi:hypothetical protein